MTVRMGPFLGDCCYNAPGYASPSSHVPEVFEMNIALTPEMERFVEEKLRTGGFHSASEVVNSALAALREAETLTPEDVAELRSDIHRAIAQLDRGEGEPW